jgi:hypothetical protein
MLLDRTLDRRNKVLMAEKHIDTKVDAGERGSRPRTKEHDMTRTRLAEFPGKRAAVLNDPTPVAARVSRTALEEGEAR